MGKQKDEQGGKSTSTVTLMKADEASVFEQRLKTGALVMTAGMAAAATAYLFGDDLRDLIGAGLNWLGERIASWL